MDNKEDSEQPTDTTDRNSPSPVPPETAESPREIPANSKNDPKEDKGTARELAREFRWFEVLSLAVNGVLAVVGIFALIIYNGQLKVMRRQLDQMKDGSTQTDKLIAATEELAKAATNQAIVMR